MKKAQSRAMMIKILLWAALIVLVYLFVRKFVVGVGTEVIGPGEALLP